MRIVPLLILVACTKEDPTDTGDPVGPSGLPVLGGGQHTLDAVEVREIQSLRLHGPRDLAFHPAHPELVLVANRDDNSVVVFDVDDQEPVADLRDGPYNEHFLAEPAGIAFGDGDYFATIHEEDEVTQDFTPTDFMGPTLWISDMDEFEGGWASHYDMLHNSPNGVGIAWDEENAYWVFDGYHESITWYDFHEDHGPGGDDHSDGEVYRYVEGEVAYAPDVASNLAFDHDERLLYIADSGNGRVAVLDPAGAERGSRIQPNYDYSDQYHMEGADIDTFADGDDADGLSVPSGLDLRDGHVFVGDNETGVVFAFTTDGALVDWIDLEIEPGGLQGLTFDAEGDLWVVDSADEKLIEISAP